MAAIVQQGQTTFAPTVFLYNRQAGRTDFKGNIVLRHLIQRPKTHTAKQELRYRAFVGYNDRMRIILL